MFTTTKSTSWPQVASFPVVVLCLFAAGCTQSDGNAKLPSPDEPRTDAAGVQATKGLLATYGSPEGLEPDAIIARDVTVTTEHGQFQIEGSAVVHGAAGIVQVDPDSGELLWRAGTCVNSACIEQGEGGRPFLFVFPYDASKINPTSGKMLTNVFEEPVCPKCGQSKFIHEYVLPGVVDRRAQLDAELRASRTIRHAAKTRGTDIPENIRKPNDIVRERALLPRLYLPASINAE